MARAKDDRLVLKEVYLQVLRMTSSFNFPVYIALAIFSNEIVALLYGSKFSGAGTYLRVLAAWGLLRSIGNPVGSLLYAVGFTRRAMIWNLAMLLSLPTAYYFAASELGLRGLAFSLLATQVALLVPAWRYLIRPCCGAGLGEFLWQVFVPLALSLTAGACAVIAVSPFSSQIIRISLGTLVGGAAYTALCYKFNLPWLSAMLELLFIRQSRTSIWPFRDSNPKGGE
jgi:O-antigen/teichoic acid export membrane protein